MVYLLDFILYIYIYVRLLHLMENKTNVFKHIASLPFLKCGIFNLEGVLIDTPPLMSQLRKQKSRQVEWPQDANLVEPDPAWNSHLATPSIQHPTQPL